TPQDDVGRAAEATQVSPAHDAGELVRSVEGYGDVDLVAYEDLEKAPDGTIAAANRVLLVTGDVVPRRFPVGTSFVAQPAYDATLVIPASLPRPALAPKKRSNSNRSEASDVWIDVDDGDTPAPAPAIRPRLAKAQTKPASDPQEETRRLRTAAQRAVRPHDPAAARPIPPAEKAATTPAVNPATIAASLAQLFGTPVPAAAAADAADEWLDSILTSSRETPKKQEPEEVRQKAERQLWFRRSRTKKASDPKRVTNVAASLIEHHSLEMDVVDAVKVLCGDFVDATHVRDRLPYETFNEIADGKEDKAFDRLAQKKRTDHHPPFTQFVELEHALQQIAKLETAVFTSLGGADWVHYLDFIRTLTLNPTYGFSFVVAYDHAFRLELTKTSRIVYSLGQAGYGDPVFHQTNVA
ncbi:hypothetical protein JCM5296_005917, partial [Sporobolomyces johnsonii]